MTRMWMLVPLSGAMVGCGEITEGPFSYDGVDAVEVRLSNGDLSVRASTSDRVELEVDFGGIARPGTVGHSVDEGVLVLDYDCALCGGDLTLLVPDGVPVQAELARGDLSLESLTGPVVASVQSGQLSGVDLACDANLSTRAGAVELAYSVRPRLVLAQTTMGSVDLELPAGRYDFDFGHTVGVVDLTDVEHDPTAAARVAAQAELGSVSIVGI